MSPYGPDRATVWVWPEVEHDQLRLYLKWQCADHWRTVLDSLKQHFHWPQHGRLHFTGEPRKLWWVPIRERTTLERWLAYTFEPEAVHWDEEPAGPYGRTYSQSRRYSGTRQSRASTTSSVDAAYAALHLLPTAPAWAAEAVYRAAIKVHHPDAGGDAQTMVRVNVAMQTIREHQDDERRAS